MATSKVEIVNSALNKLGASTISSLTDNSKEGILANVQYEPVKRDLLRAHPWNFAITRVSLAQTANTPSFEYDYEYLIPSDVLRILDVEIPAERYSIEHNQDDGTRVLLTDNDAVKIKYLKDIDDVTLFDANFCEVFSARLAAEFAYALTGSISVMDKMFALYQEQLRNARSYDGQEGTPPEVEADSWINQRY